MLWGGGRKGEARREREGGTQREIEKEGRNEELWRVLLFN